MKLTQIPDAYKSRFENRLNAENVQRLKVTAVVLVFFCILYLLQYKFAPDKENKSVYFGHYVFLFASMGIFSILFRVMLPLIHNRASLFAQNIIFTFYTALIFLYCICLTILDLSISNDYSAYAIGVLGVPFVLRLSFPRFCVLVAAGFFFFTAGITLFLGRPLHISLVLPVFVFSVFALFISHSFWKTRNQIDFLRYKVEQKNDALKETAFRDPLTRAYNRRFMVQFLIRQIAGFKRNGTAVSLMIIDIDHFKKINDRLGHAAGDKVLIEISDLLITCSRGADITARYGGEEFVIICPETGKNQALNLARRMRKKIEAHPFEGVDWTVTASIGVSEIIETDNEDSLIDRADQNLYKAKRSGRNCCVS